VHIIHASKRTGCLSLSNYVQIRDCMDTTAGVRPLNQFEHKFRNMQLMKKLLED